MIWILIKLNKEANENVMQLSKYRQAYYCVSTVKEAVIVNVTYITSNTIIQGLIFM